MFFDVCFCCVPDPLFCHHACVAAAPPGGGGGRKTSKIYSRQALWLRRPVGSLARMRNSMTEAHGIMVTGLPYKGMALTPTRQIDSLVLFRQHLPLDRRV